MDAVLLLAELWGERETMWLAASSRGVAMIRSRITDERERERVTYRTTNFILERERERERDLGV